jgi:hypothetical protein
MNRHGIGCIEFVLAFAMTVNSLSAMGYCSGANCSSSSKDGGSSGGHGSGGISPGAAAGIAVGAAALGAIIGGVISSQNQKDGNTANQPPETVPAGQWGTHQNSQTGTPPGNMVVDTSPNSTALTQAQQAATDSPESDKLKSKITDSMSGGAGFLGETGFLRNFTNRACVGTAQSRNKCAADYLKANPNVLGSNTVELGTRTIPGHTYNIFRIKGPDGKVKYEGYYDDYLKQMKGEASPIKWKDPGSYNDNINQYGDSIDYNVQPKDKP